MRRPSTLITVGSGESSRETSLYGFRIGSTCSTPGYPSSGSAASASRSPIAPITVASRPGVTCASAPASASRATTWSISSGVAWAPMTIRSSGDPVTAIGTQDTFALTMRIFSGIQPTGAKHLGNYIGAIRQWVEAQDDSLFCIVDLHSISVAYDPEDLRESTYSLAALLIACGLDPERCILFVQSHNPDHAQGNWLLSSVTSFGELRRMTQFKDKGEQQQF